MTRLHTSKMFLVALAVFFLPAYVYGSESTDGESDAKRIFQWQADMVGLATFCGTIFEEPEKIKENVRSAIDLSDQEKSYFLEIFSHPDRLGERYADEWFAKQQIHNFDSERISQEKSDVCQDFMDMRRIYRQIQP